MVANKLISVRDPIVGQEDNFIVKLMPIIENPAYVKEIKWSKDGTTFMINREAFEQSVLLNHMQGTLFESFTRRLLRWGFERVILKDTPKGVVVYRHALFRRGQAHLIKNATSKGMRAAAHQRTIPAHADVPKEPTTVMPKGFNIPEASYSRTGPVIVSAQKPHLVGQHQLRQLQYAHAADLLKQRYQECSVQRMTPNRFVSMLMAQSSQPNLFGIRNPRSTPQPTGSLNVSLDSLDHRISLALGTIHR